MLLLKTSQNTKFRCKTKLRCKNSTPLSQTLPPSPPTQHSLLYLLRPAPRYLESQQTPQCFCPLSAPISWAVAYTHDEHAAEIKYLVPLPPSPSHFFSVEPPWREFLLLLLTRYLIYTMTAQVPATLVQEQL